MCVNGWESEYPFSVNFYESEYPKTMNPVTFMNPEKFSTSVNLVESKLL